MIGVRQLLVVGVVTAVTGALPVGVARAAGAPLAAAPSAFCHVSDGTFTTCPDGAREWSDVTPAAFAATGAFLYSDQADLVPDVGIPGSPVDTLMLMYDECAATAPLGPDDYFLVSFDNVEGSGATGDPERIERYTVHVFGDGTLILLVNGKVQSNQNGQIRATEIDGQRGRAGFGPSPNCATRHLTVEYQIPLAAATGAGITAVGGGAARNANGGDDGYSPDPLFWSSTPPRHDNPRTGDRDQDGVRDDLDNCPDTPNTGQADTDLDGIGDACTSPDQHHATAAFVQAAPDGRTGVDSTDTALGKEPDLTDRLIRIVQFRIDSGRADSAVDLTDNLVGSLVTLGLVAPSDAAALKNAVLAGVDKAPDCTGVSVRPAVLWPAHGQRVAVTVTGATDPDPGDRVSVAVTAITQDEPVSHPGVRSTAPDAGPVQALGSAWLRAERDRGGDGRVYRLGVTATDQAGRSCRTTVTVAVPRHRGRVALDSAEPSYDSLTGSTITGT